MSLFTTISGITNNQSMLDVIGDNLANINTTAFKSSKMNFASIFSNTISVGGTPTATSGGVNPKQIGLGVTVAEISRNFARGAIQSTGKSADLNIQGEGFFTIVDPSGKMLLSRAGNFSVDSGGNLVSPVGYKVAGTASTTSQTGSTTAINMPTSLVLNETNVISDGTTAVTGGPASAPLQFMVTVNGTSSQIDVLNTDTTQDIVNKINSKLTSSTATLNSNQIAISGTDTVVIGDSADTSNFAAVANFTGSSPTYTSATLTDTPKVDIGEASAAGSALPNTYTVSSYSILNDGAIEVSYSNGAKLSVTGEPSRTLKYVSSGSKEVSGNNVTQSAGNFIDPAQLQLQLAQVVNPKGLEAIGGNLFSINSAAGNPSFAIGRSGGLGSIDSGSLETSNVDLPTEFANMILAQKAVEANSRAFSVQNQIMDTIVNLGR